MSINEQLIEELRDLPSTTAHEVLDFILFLKHREERAFMERAAESSLMELWENPEEDAAWKDL